MAFSRAQLAVLALVVFRHENFFEEIVFLSLFSGKTCAPRKEEVFPQFRKLLITCLTCYVGFCCCCCRLNFPCRDIYISSSRDKKMLRGNSLALEIKNSSISVSLSLFLSVLPLFSWLPNRQTSTTLLLKHSF